MQSLPHKPVGVSTYDWETDSYTYNASTMDPAQIWRSAVALAATKARQALPECSTRIDKAIEMVLNNAVELLPDGTARVTSQYHGTRSTVYTVANGSCSCPDGEKAPQQFCKHRLAVALTVRAVQLAKELGSSTGFVTMTQARVQAPQGTAQAAPPVSPPPAVPDGTTAAPEPDEPAPESSSGQAIPAQFLATIQGKQFVLFSGLLAMATSQGLLSLTEEFTHITDTYVLAQSRAEFHDGRVFRGAADSAPDNVGKQVKPHWRRMALTRAKARALRDALNINLVAVEELD